MCSSLYIRNMIWLLPLLPKIGSETHLFDFKPLNFRILGNQTAVSGVSMGWKPSRETRGRPEEDDWKSVWSADTRCQTRSSSGPGVRLGCKSNTANDLSICNHFVSWFGISRLSRWTPEAWKEFHMGYRVDPDFFNMYQYKRKAALDAQPGGRNRLLVPLQYQIVCPSADTDIFWE